MAAVSGSHTSIVTTNSLSSGQFQFAEPRDNAPRPNATKQTPLATTNKQRADSMAQPSHPALGQAVQQHPSATESPDRNRSASLTAAFGTPELEFVTNPLLESILRPNKDGRVKNPVPSKLKGKTDAKKGNFSVMHMGTTPGKKNDAGKDAAAERDAAARRTSENTASRAKAAQQDKYVPPRRRGLEAEASSNAVKSGSPAVAGRDDQKQRGRPLAPDETKIEQARLLTLLRSLNPITVVDQICKAVAYFGGIPGAPPPEDGIFPVSANTKETGALFIGWLAEIFPDISSLGVQRAPDAAGSVQSRLSMGPQLNEPPNPSNGFGYGQAISAPVWGLPQAAPPAVPSVTPDAVPSSNATPVQNAQPEPPRPSTPARQPPPEAPPPTTSTSKRGRGRPKGSRNKGKNATQNAAEAAGSTGQDTTSQNPSFVSAVSNDSSGTHGTPAKIVQPDAPPTHTASIPAGGLNQPPISRYQESSWQGAQKAQTEPGSSILPATVDELSPEERAVVEAFRQQDTSEAAKATTLTPLSFQSSTGAKRKRATPKPKVVATPLSKPPEQSQSTPSVASNPISSTDGSMQIGGSALTWPSIETSTPTAPPAKRPRQRKPKASAGTEASQSQVASVASNSTPPITAHALPDPISASQQVPPTRPPAEGLEAHYEKYTRPQQIQQQQNGSNHAPSIVQQQQLRQQKTPAAAQQQKATSVSQQQQQPQQPQQKPAAQMQQQKSQQSGQRDDQKTTQGSSVRPASTAFYNPRSHGPFSHQYPASQTSQLYGTHQSSPQMNAASSNSNSFRASNAHGLGQVSPQFAQADAYRTASPRSISQGSPTFSQADTSFRSASAHSVTQPSPNYAQAEKLYRAANTQPITQAASSFSRTHNQAQASHQSHYNHFSDNPYTDLPTLENLSHGGGSGHAGVSLGSSGSFGQQAGASGGAMGTSSRAAGTGSLYGTSSHGGGSVFDATAANDQLLRAVSRPAGSNGAYGTSSSLGPGGGGFEPGGAADQDLRERLMRNIGRR